MHPIPDARNRPPATTLAGLAAAALVSAVIPAAAGLAFLISLAARRADLRQPRQLRHPRPDRPGRRSHPGRPHHHLAAPQPGPRPAGPQRISSARS